MRIELKKFGHILLSHAAGRESWLAAQAYILPKLISDKIEVDFSGVEVFAPSWAEEFIIPLKELYGDKVILLPSDNPTVKATLKTIL